MTITPGTANFIIYQGATFNQLLQFLDANQEIIPLSGYSATMMIRALLGDQAPVTTLSTAAGSIILDNTTNITLTLSSTATAALPIIKNGVYDFRLTNTSTTEVDYLLQGSLIIQQMVTR